MAATLPHIEDSNNTTYFPPKGDFVTFDNDEHYIEKLKEWGLSTTKESFWYKDRTFQRLVTIKGYEAYGVTDEFNTIVLEFQDGNLTCIHPAYLKEMQSPSFEKANVTLIEKDKDQAASKKTTPPSKQSLENAEQKKTVAKKAEKKTEKKTKIGKLELPVDKVHFTAKVKQFALSWNNFNEENDEVVVLENVVIQQESPLEVGLAWCSHSKTLKKFELAPGDVLEFDGKIVKKKLPKGKDAEEEFIIEEAVPYKINNPSKIKKE
ncbi:hypothetical protein [Bacillus tuaregi]|uniref:hypothetical protein n=1 Tax=Bacillus tuaregi TaxID=1816695 RepID=UPI0008F962AC|nr:hypothetical protein [Bacillus tuaregi]